MGYATLGAAARVWGANGDYVDLDALQAELPAGVTLRVQGQFGPVVLYNAEGWDVYRFISVEQMRRYFGADLVDAAAATAADAERLAAEEVATRSGVQPGTGTPPGDELPDASAPESLQAGAGSGILSALAWVGIFLGLVRWRGT